MIEFLPDSTDFMNKFKKLGFINYSGYKGRLTVFRSLLSVFLHD